MIVGNHADDSTEDYTEDDSDAREYMNVNKKHIHVKMFSLSVNAFAFLFFQF